MVVDCRLCGKTDAFRRGRNGRSGDTGSYLKMRAEVEKFMGACPNLCQVCLSEINNWIFSERKRRLFERNRRVTLPPRTVA